MPRHWRIVWTIQFQCIFNGRDTYHLPRIPRRSWYEIPLPKLDPLGTCGVLCECKRFLILFCFAVIPSSLYEQALECHTYNQCKQLISNLTAVHYNVFYYLIAFLREVLTHSNKNALPVDKLGTIKIPLFLCPWLMSFFFSQSVFYCTATTSWHPKHQWRSQPRY
jgi:hypothetical protein